MEWQWRCMATPRSPRRIQDPYPHATQKNLTQITRTAPPIKAAAAARTLPTHPVGTAPLFEVVDIALVLGVKGASTFRVRANRRPASNQLNDHSYGNSHRSRTCHELCDHGEHRCPAWTPASQPSVHRRTREHSQSSRVRRVEPTGARQGFGVVAARVPRRQPRRHLTWGFAS